MVVVSTARDTVPLVPPPVRPVPAVTPAMPPLPVSSVSQSTVPSALMTRIDEPAVQLPVTRAWIAVVSIDSDRSPPLPPPCRPVPAVTPVTMSSFLIPSTLSALSATPARMA